MRKWIEIYYPQEPRPGPYIQDVTEWPQTEITKAGTLFDYLGGRWELKEGTPPDMQKGGD